MLGGRADDGSSPKDLPIFQNTVNLLKIAVHEPIGKMNAAGLRFVLKRVDRIFKEVEEKFFFEIKDGKRRTKPEKAAVISYYALEFLLRTEVLELFEGSTMGTAMENMIPMFDRAFTEAKLDKSAKKQAVKLLDFLVTRKYFEPWANVREAIVAELEAEQSAT